MATIVTRSGKGSALTFAEMDANFVNINNELANVSLGVLPANSVSATELDNSGDFTVNTLTTTGNISVGDSIKPSSGNLEINTDYLVVSDASGTEKFKIRTDQTPSADQILKYNEITGFVQWANDLGTSSSQIQNEIANTALNDLSDVDTSGVTDGQALVYVSANTQWEPGTVASTTELLNDTSPQLGGNLDVNGNDIVSVSDNINLTPDGNVVVALDNTNEWYEEGSSRLYVNNTTFGSGIAVGDGKRSTPNDAGFGLDAFSFANQFGGSQGGQMTQILYSPASPLAAYGDNTSQAQLGVLRKFEWKDGGSWTKLTDAATTANSNVVLSASDGFVDAEVGDIIRIEGAGDSTSTSMSGNLSVEITAVNGNGNIEISEVATNTGTYDAYLLTDDETAVEWRSGAPYGKHVERHFATTYGDNITSGEGYVDYQLEAKRIYLKPQQNTATYLDLTGTQARMESAQDIILNAGDDVDIRASDSFQFRNKDSDTGENNETVTLIHQRTVTPQGSGSGLIVESSDDKVGSDYPTQLVIRRFDEGNGTNTAHANVEQRIASYDLTLESTKSTLSLNYVDDDNTGAQNNTATLLKFKNSSSETVNANTQSAPDMVEFGVMAQLKSYANTALPTGVAGAIIAISTNSYKPAYHDGSVWKYVADDSTVT